MTFPGKKPTLKKTEGEACSQASPFFCAFGNKRGRHSRQVDMVDRFLAVLTNAFLSKVLLFGRHAL
jgi:hypothetical protein